MCAWAVNKAAACGGGKIILEPGVYPSGTIHLKSNIELHSFLLTNILPVAICFCGCILYKRAKGANIFYE
jgi:hypothetical protein